MRWNEKHNTLSLTKKDVAELTDILRDYYHCMQDMDGNRDAWRVKRLNRWQQDLEFGIDS